ncbi:glycosyltransferase family protein [Flavihumibacter petaseus]|uniref:Glycosyltransferase n=1 Tax=Flavihumibacter petaseus NBRC 106054 TaxID=1220578 RepID=A0A0E9MY55_9BACT|nr:glycosyltransferase family protein [Flavihumibacter petaseus]GAO42060.1 hypothetical protein FPE01S_01_10730 [Flavihumibacter petaseus NBRC 106054]
MKIFYAVQATGNGHIARATALLPYLQRYGKVDVFLSGGNSQLQTDLPCRYRSRGLSLFYNTSGGLQYGKIARQLQPARVWREIRELPVEQYDVVLNDFESITSLACAYKKVPSLQLGHQAAFQSPLAPRPAKNEMMGEFLLKHYARATAYVGLHFRRYDHHIFEPVIKKEILQAKPVNKGHITVYLSAFSAAKLKGIFSAFTDTRFEIFSKDVTAEQTAGNIRFLPVQQRLFNESMIRSAGVITGAGFETPAEILHLGKRLMVIPIRGQYEQLCNAAALEGFGVKVLQQVDDSFSNTFREWQQAPAQQKINYGNNIPELLQYAMDSYPQQKVSLEYLYPEMLLA